jgi:hypothetical protein
MTRPKLLVDSHGRVLRDLRLSLTDRCNFPLPLLPPGNRSGTKLLSWTLGASARFKTYPATVGAKERTPKL